MKIILGSSSKARRQILEEHGFEFEIMVPNIDEKQIRTDDFYQLPLLLARAKAQALVPRMTEPAYIVAADQVVICDGELYEKPKSEEEARAYLKKYSDGHPAETVSAVVVINSKTGISAEGVDIAKTFYNQLPDFVVDEFIKHGDPYSKAGGYAIQSPILKPHLKKIVGTIDSIMAMPIDLLKDLLAKVSK